MEKKLDMLAYDCHPSNSGRKALNRKIVLHANLGEKSENLSSKQPEKNTLRHGLCDRMLALQHQVLSSKLSTAKKQTNNNKC
jgi:hypothetical protein